MSKSDNPTSADSKRSLPSASSMVIAGLVLVAAYLLTSLTGVPQRLADGLTPDDSACQPHKPSKLAIKYLEKLHGLEIGASTENSFGLKRAINVDFSDEQGGLWQSKKCEPAVVNLVALGDDLPFKDSTLDYVLSSHVIEHFFDPVKALREWLRVVKPGGYLFIIAPHHDRTFDRNRQVTPVEELMKRASGEIKLTDYAKPGPGGSATVDAGKTLPLPDAEPQKLMRDKTAPLPAGWNYFQEDDHHHWTVWRTQDFADLAKRLKLNVVEVQDVDDKVGNGFIIVIRK